MEDCEQLLGIYARYVEKTAVSFEYKVPSPEEFASRMKRISQWYPYLVVETTVYIKYDCKRMGIGRLLYFKLEEALKKQGVLNMNACIACAEEEDEFLPRDSVLFHTKMGFKQVGTFHKCGYKFDRWYDMMWMEKHIGPHEHGQERVCPFPNIKNFK